MPFAYNGATRLHYQVYGEGPALLFLPGLGVGVREMQPISEALAAHARVITVDNRGVGLSEMPRRPYSIALMAEDAVAVLNAAAVAEAHVLGFSMGGRIAIELALTAPYRVESLVLLATGARWLPRWRRDLFFAVAPYLPIGPKPRQPAYAFRGQRHASEEYDARERLGEVRPRTLVLHGREDRVAPPLLAEELHAGIPSSRLRWYDGGHHAPMTDARQQVVDTVADFIS